MSVRREKPVVWLMPRTLKSPLARLHAFPDFDDNRQVASYCGIYYATVKAEDRAADMRSVARCKNCIKWLEAKKE